MPKENEIALELLKIAANYSSSISDLKTNIAIVTDCYEKIKTIS